MEITAIKSEACEAIDKLKKLKDALNKLQTNLRDLNSRRDDVIEMRNAEIQRRRKLKKEVADWFDDVEHINDQIQEAEDWIKSVCSNKSIREIISQIIEKAENRNNRERAADVLVPRSDGNFLPSTDHAPTSENNGAKDISFQGLGGIGQTMISNKNTTIKVKFTENHYHR